ncbi:MAG: response regulator transcription factor [Leptospiraceae bacterium]|nr:response regulator transcription factor [Leptospiraceae bacterium]
MVKIKVLLFDDHEVFLEGMKFVLTENTHYTVDSVLTEDNFREKISRENYKVFILDFVVPGTNMLDIISLIQEKLPDAKIIVLSSLKDRKLYKTLKERKVNGYIFKSEARLVILQAIETILKGNEFYSDPENAEIEKIESFGNPFDAVTEKEIEIIRYIVKGVSNKKIAEALNISARTVEAHKRNIDMKLGKLSKAQLIKLAEKWKLVE